MGPDAPDRPWRRSVRTASGLLLLGYGLLVLTGVLAHDAAVAGVAAAVLGAALLAGPLRSDPGDRDADRLRGQLPRHGGGVRGGRAAAVLALGLAAAGGVLGHAAATGSDLALPEVALLAYGAALVAAAPRLDRRVGRVDVGTLVAWSFPLVLAPLGVYALHALLADATPAPAVPLLRALLAEPLAAALGLLGDPAVVRGAGVVLATPRGTLALEVGMVCAGLYPMVMFAGLVALHGWQRRLPPGRVALYLALGLAGLHAANLLRLVMLAKVGQAWGAGALEVAHAHLGWVLFAGFATVFWGLVVRRIEGPAAAPSLNP